MINLTNNLITNLVSTVLPPSADLLMTTTLDDHNNPSQDSVGHVLCNVILVQKMRFLDVHVRPLHSPYMGLSTERTQG